MSRRYFLSAFLGLAIGPLAVPGLSAPSAWAVPADIVILQAMDKITARVSRIEVPVGGAVTFGSLTVTARACDKHPPEETPEAAAFLEVVEQKPGEAAQQRFQGWMFASSPALSAMEHPVYDLWVLDCTGGEADAGAAPAASDSNAASAPSGSSE